MQNNAEWMEKEEGREKEPNHLVYDDSHFSYYHPAECPSSFTAECDESWKDSAWNHTKWKICLKDEKSFSNIKRSNFNLIFVFPLLSHSNDSDTLSLFLPFYFFLHSFFFFSFSTDFPNRSTFHFVFSIFVRSRLSLLPPFMFTVSILIALCISRRERMRKKDRRVAAKKLSIIASQVRMECHEFWAPQWHSIRVTVKVEFRTFRVRRVGRREKWGKE